MKPLVSLLASLLCFSASTEAQLPEGPVFELKSPDFAQGGPIPKRFTCDGAGHSPGLLVSGVPQAAKSLVLIMDDPDAPKGTFTHWLMWNLPPDLREIVAGTQPREGIQGKNSAGKVGYFPPCPPSGEHRYYFRLYALDFQIHLPASAAREALEKAMKAHVQKETLIMGRYSRGAEKAGR